VEPYGSMKCWETFQQLSKRWFLVSLFYFNLGLERHSNQASFFCSICDGVVTNYVVLND
jgi:hypothetical protein